MSRSRHVRTPHARTARSVAGDGASAPAVLAGTVDVSVVIVTYNVREFLEQALDAVARASTGLTVETWVVDNDSADGSVAMVRERFPDVHVIANTENVGFATANNQALRLARGRHVLVLNPDTVVEENTLRRLVAYLDAHPHVGAVGPRILNPDGTFAPESRRAFPTPAVAFYRISGLGRLFPKSRRFGRYNLTFLPEDQPCEVDALSGSCMMVRRAAILSEPGAASGEQEMAEPRSSHRLSPAPRSPLPAGLFDESFFMYGEDLDWCYRIQQAGWAIHYAPVTEIIHYKGESTKKGDLRYVMLFYGAMLRFVEKHISPSAGEGWQSRAGRRLLALGLRTGIVARGVVAAAGRLAQHVAAPVRDGAVAWASLAAAAFLWSAVRGIPFGERYYTVVVSAYALTLVAALHVAGAYGRRPARRALRLGVLMAVAAVASASFFVPEIAFSRATPLFGYALAAAALATVRHVGRRSSARRALVVGTADEAARLARLLDAQADDHDLPLPPDDAPALTVVGYVADRPGHRPADAPPHVGPMRQLRDLVRLHRADDVVFAADSLTNTSILAGMRALADAPVHLKILASGRDLIIGKASVEDLAAPLVDAERTVAPLRPNRRWTDAAVAAVLLAVGPLVRLAARLRPGRRTARAVALLRRMPDVLAGRLALVGYDPDGPHPPPAWGLEPGAVSVLDTRRRRPTDITEAHRAYWAYARHQSLALDLDILAKVLRG